MAKKLRTRKHRVVLNRSAGGDAGISFFLIIIGLFMFIPMLYAVLQSLKPLDELWVFPPKFWVEHPTFDNFLDLFRLMNTSWVPFSRYIFNTVLISVAGTFGNLILASMAAYVLSKIKFPGRNIMFNLIVKSLMFHSTVGAILPDHVQASFCGYILGGHRAGMGLDPGLVSDEAVHGFLGVRCGSGIGPAGRCQRVPHILFHCHAHGKTGMVDHDRVFLPGIVELRFFHLHLQ